MHRLFLISAATALAFFALVSPVWAAWVWPLSGEVITRYSNGSDPYAGGQHRGIDIAGETGQPVVAAAGGSVRFAGTAGSSGLTVSIRTTDGFDTSYLHLSSASVLAGQTVVAGERVGAVGTSGTRSTERPHLHFGVREAGSRHAYRDPLAFLPAAPPAAEGPRGAPAPQPAPAPNPPQPVPAPPAVPAGERVPARRGAIRRRVPARAAAPAADPGRQGSPAARPAPIPQATSPSPARPGVQPDAAPEAEHQPQRAPRGAASARLAEIRRPSPSASRAPRSPAPAVAASPPAPEPINAGQRGPDLGLLLACVGLLGAAALLGLSEDGRAVTRRTGQRAAGMLRPLLSRR
jgi:Peptidase family M23